MIFKKLSGVHVPHHKNTQNSPARKIHTPQTVCIPLSMHIGAPAKLLVKAGDFVTVGQLIAEAGGFISAPIHASVSGVVKKIDEILLTNGTYCPAVIIESDGKMEVSPDVKPPVVDSLDTLVEAVKNSGIVGLGGAGFPTYVKLKVDKERVDTIVINGAECEPYITSDTYTMLHETDNICYALKVLAKYLEVDNIVIGIENNKKNCISHLMNATKDMPYVKVKSLEALYPQGGEKVLIYNTTGRIVPQGKLPLDVGVIVLNCTTLASIGKFIKTGMPLTEKCVTVDGSCVCKPDNLLVPIGTPFSVLFEECGGLKCDPGKILAGGPMMGITVKDDSYPVLKNTNAVLALSKNESKTPKTTACIRCGRCISHCPLSLNPVAISKAYSNNDTNTLEKLNVNLCMECGCCSYICPTKQPLVQRNKLSKALLRSQKAKEAK